MADPGRPTIWTEETFRRIEEVAALDGTIEEMALFADIHPSTIYVRLKEDEEFSDRIKSLREKPVLKARRTIIASLNDPNHAFRYVERKRKKEFGNAIDVTTDGEKITNVDPRTLALAKEYEQKIKTEL